MRIRIRREELRTMRLKYECCRIRGVLVRFGTALLIATRCRRGRDRWGHRARGVAEGPEQRIGHPRGSRVGPVERRIDSAHRLWVARDRVYAGVRARARRGDQERYDDSGSENGPTHDGGASAG